MATPPKPTPSPEPTDQLVTLLSQILERQQTIERYLTEHAKVAPAAPPSPLAALTPLGIPSHSHDRDPLDAYSTQQNRHEAVVLPPGSSLSLLDLEVIDLKTKQLLGKSTDAVAVFALCLTSSGTTQCITLGEAGSIAQLLAELDENRARTAKHLIQAIKANS